MRLDEIIGPPSDFRCSDATFASDEAWFQKRLNNNQLGTRSFRAAVLYFGYSLCDELRLHSLSIGWRSVGRSLNGAHDNGD